ncbi:MAG TPA: acetyl-CoA carboxylase biotin carboxyl carrier protein subunit [Ktedonobacterales bacterium]|nr:acetyl-CoA carboxylase biotin carboxyl carrier protein subunit [Ktedonobacterales bacterium]
MVRERVERGGDTPPQPAQNPLSIAEIRQLISLMSGSDIEEIAIEQDGHGVKLRLAKPAPVAVAFGDDGGYEDGALLGELAAEEDDASKPYEIGAPLVGVFRTNMKSNGKALVQVGDIVRQGQVIAAIEALNVLNEVEAGAAGRVSEILATDGQPVEYGQTLLVIDPRTA